MTLSFSIELLDSRIIIYFIFNLKLALLIVIFLFIIVKLFETICIV